MKKKVEIELEELIRLAKRDLELELLECGGVDNWSWYGESLNPEGELSFYERCEELEKELIEKYS